MSDGDKRTLNALLSAANTVPLEQEIRRLIAVHGADAVKHEIKAATKPRRGRKQEKDWPLLHPYLLADAKDWLAGRDPWALRSQKGIAREVAMQILATTRTALCVGLSVSWRNSESDSCFTTLTI